MDHVSQWAASHGVATKTVDGNDVEAVYRAALDGIAHIRATRQPYVLETYTYRTRGHVEPDDQSYVDKAELAGWLARDPIEQLARKLALDPSEVAAARARATAVVEAAWTAACAAVTEAAGLVTPAQAGVHLVSCRLRGILQGAFGNFCPGRISSTLVLR